MNTLFNPPSAIRHPQSPAGFTLMEVLIAMGIFAIGMVAVAAIFPAAAMLQKQTVDSVLGQQVANNAQALLSARKWADEADVISDVDAAVPDDGEVHPLRSTSSGGTSYLGDWSRRDRAYPSTSVDNNGVGANFYWVPLIRKDVDNNDWQVFAFILKRAERGNYTKTPVGDFANPDDPPSVPGVARIISVTASGSTFTFANSDRKIKPGDPILDNNGVIYHVKEANDNGVKIVGIIPKIPSTPTEIWYGQPADKTNPTDDFGPSPCKRIVILSNVVQ